jgi:CRISPR-associated endonuclease/helicase Cas3
MPGTAAVYKNHARLWKTAALLEERKGWILPEDARHLIESVYDDQRMGIPEALEASHYENVGDALAKRQHSNYAKLNLHGGYKASAQWKPEEKAATRLTEEETETVFLARWKGDELVPLIEAENYPWDLSSLKLRSSQVPRAKHSAETEAAMEWAKAQSKRLNEYSTILALTPTEHRTWGVEDSEYLEYDQRFGLYKKQ